MNNFMLLVSLIAISIACCEAQLCGSVCQGGQRQNVVCVVDEEGRICRRVRQCTVDEENCQRAAQGQAGLITDDINLCRNIQRIGAQGRCARRNCNFITCYQEHRQFRSYRINRNLCKWATVCTSVVENCQRSANDQLRKADDRRCRGMRIDGVLRRCSA